MKTEFCLQQTGFALQLGSSTVFLSSFNVLMPPLLLVTLLVQSNLEGIGAGVGDMQSLLFALLILGKSFFPEFFSELFYFQGESTTSTFFLVLAYLIFSTGVTFADAGGLVLCVCLVVFLGAQTYSSSETCLTSTSAVFSFFSLDLLEDLGTQTSFYSFFCSSSGSKSSLTGSTKLGITL